MSANPYRYSVDGVIHDRVDEEYFDSIGLDAERRQHVLSKQAIHIVTVTYYERKWRDEELSKSDLLMFEDSTYGGVPVVDHPNRDELLTYRQELRDYVMDGNRPTRPEWLEW